jgi:hypothetical protein
MEIDIVGTQNPEFVGRGVELMVWIVANEGRQIASSVVL